MKRYLILIVAGAVLSPAVARAQHAATQSPAPHAEHAGAHASQHDALAKFVFPPELVMQHQREIGLKAEQRTAITRAVQEFQNKTLEFQWQMQDESQRLAELLEKPSVDQAAALAQVDKVLGVEREVKRAHMSLLIQIKNSLTPEQQTRLRALAPKP